MRPIIAYLSLGMLFSSSAWAQVTEATLEVELPEEIRYIGIDDCPEAVAESVTIKGNLLTTVATAYTLTLSWSTDAACAASKFEACDGVPVTDDDDRCGCLKTSQTDSVTYQGSLSGLGEDLCALDQGSTRTLRFYLSWTDEDGDEEEVTSGSSSVVIDYLPPTQPTVAPTVRAVDKGFIIELDSSDLQDLDTYEACWWIGESPVPPDLSDCGTVSADADKLEVDTGELVEDTFNIAYRFIDLAGNKGPFSAVVTEQVRSFRGFPEEFARIYDESCQGLPCEGKGERGGCQSTPGGAPWAWLLIPLLALLRIRR